MRITLVRHGETTGQSSIRYYGITDVPLSELGRQQMRCVARALAGERFDAVLSSRLIRSREGASIVTADRLAVRPIAAFDEVNFGRWEGWTREEIAERDPEEYARWQAAIASGVFQYPEGESRAAFDQRVRAGLAEVLADAGPGHLLMVLHRGVIAGILTELLRLTPALRAGLDIALGSIHVVARGANIWQLHVDNRIDHLAGL